MIITASSGMRRSPSASWGFDHALGAGMTVLPGGERKPISTVWTPSGRTRTTSSTGQGQRQ